MCMELKDKKMIKVLFHDWLNSKNTDPIEINEILQNIHETVLELKEKTKMEEELDKLEELYTDYGYHRELIVFAMGMKYGLKLLNELNL